MSASIKRGEIYWLQPPPAAGSVQLGRRPCVIIQNDVGNQHSPVTIVVVCTTNISKMYPTDVFITAAESGLREDTKILCNQISTIDKKQLGSKIGVVPPHKMKLVDDALKISLDLK